MVAIGGVFHVPSSRTRRSISVDTLHVLLETPVGKLKLRHALEAKAMRKYDPFCRMTSSDRCVATTRRTTGNTSQRGTNVRISRERQGPLIGDVRIVAVDS